MSWNTPFVFRGKRNHVLVADILNAVLFSLYGTPRTTDLDYAVKQPCAVQGFCLIQADSATQADHMTAMGIFHDARHDLLVLPDGPPITERAPCHEEVFMALCRLSDQGEQPSVAFACHEPEALLCHCVASFKLLLQSRVITEPQRFLFTNIKLQTTDLTDVRVSFQRMFARRYFEGKIFNAATPVGAIFFTSGSH